MGKWEAQEELRFLNLNIFYDSHYFNIIGKRAFKAIFNQNQVSECSIKLKNRDEVSHRGFTKTGRGEE
jgi:hypothetical protein